MGLAQTLLVETGASARILYCESLSTLRFFVLLMSFSDRYVHCMHTHLELCLSSSIVTLSLFSVVQNHSSFSTLHWIGVLRITFAFPVSFVFGYLTLLRSPMSLVHHISDFMLERLCEPWTGTILARSVSIYDVLSIQY